MRFITVVAVLAVMVLAVGQAQAAMIGVQLAGYQSDRYLGYSESAGVVPQTEYNVVIVAPAYPPTWVDGGTHSLPTLYDDSNTATTVTGTVSGFYKMDWCGAPDPGTPNQKLMTFAFGEPGVWANGNPETWVGGGGLVGPGILTLSNLNASGFATYDVIAYLGLGGHGNYGFTHPSTIALNGGTPVAINIMGYEASRTPDVIFVDAIANPAGGNYVRYNGLTGDTVTLAITAPPYYNGAGFTGFQILPEPATMALLALGGIGMLFNRKRRK